ncbi:hypothetical protein [Gloeobacter kilaueensis]|uniref:Uncharacterized protein n=1 Tax=Gloeobacter kilaueensis (strain ATCC BAA-2537 / CCAP 1431/1 / ULC 316 / JS1) TaxID=1183438 RepID=U5QGI2_GLOK1|nr:hypothetical protein [Gloeobacter kilaueensis]AGY57978.1 hypothetical protein GKIL_1732 [Gloeobacter kilaueensis JS1]
MSDTDPFNPKVLAIEITADGTPVRQLAAVLAAFRGGKTLRGCIRFAYRYRETFTAHLCGIRSSNGHYSDFWQLRYMGYDSLEVAFMDYLTGKMGL